MKKGIMKMMKMKRIRNDNNQWNDNENNGK